MGTISDTNDRFNARIRLGDKEFQPMISHEELLAAIDRVAQRINHDYRHREFPLFMGVLNGSFMFMAFS